MKVPVLKLLSPYLQNLDQVDIDYFVNVDEEQVLKFTRHLRRFVDKQQVDPAVVYAGLAVLYLQFREILIKLLGVSSEVSSS